MKSIIMNDILRLSESKNDHIRFVMTMNSLLSKNTSLKTLL